MLPWQTPDIELCFNISLTSRKIAGQSRNSLSGSPRSEHRRRIHRRRAVPIDIEYSAAVGTVAKLHMVALDQSIAVGFTVAVQCHADIEYSPLSEPSPNSIRSLSSLYVLNAAALSKPHAVEHLAADLISYGTDVAVITETHLKAKHPDSVVGIDGYHLFRRDRARRRGRGVALYVRFTIQATVWNIPTDDRTYEILW